MNIRYALFLLLTLCLSPVWAEPILLNDRQSEYIIGRQVDVLTDPGGNFTMNEISDKYAHNFQRSQQSSPNFGLSKATYWLRFELRNGESEARDWLLEIDYPPIDDITFFEFDGTRLRRTLKTGDLLPFRERPLAVRNFIFPLQLPAKVTRLYFLRVRSDSSLQVPLSVRSPARFALQSTQEGLGFGSYFGILLVMALYNFFLFVSIRDRAYLYYVCFVLSFGMGQFVWSGMAYQHLWPEWPAWNNRALLFLLSTGATSAVAFAQAFLQTRLHATMHRLLIATLTAQILLTCTSLVASYSLSVRAAMLAIGLGAIVVFFCGLRMTIMGHRPARFFLASWVLFLCATLANNFRLVGLIPSNYVTMHGSEIGAVVQAVLLSLGLADRINILRSENELARQKLLNQEKMAAVGSMAAGIVHDFRNPVGVIKGSAELARDADTTTEELQKYLRLIEHEADRLSAMAQDVLDYTKGTLKTQKVEVSLNEFLASVRQSMDSIFAHKSIEFRIKCDEDATISLDPARFLRVLINISVNAADALTEGENFTIHARKNGQYIVFELADNGPGIPESIRANLFEPFVTQGKTHGTGLGMAIVKSIVEAHGGSIRFKTSSGEGTTFFIEVPA